MFKAQRGEADAKKPKDEKAPKRAQTDYVLFTAPERAAVKAAHQFAKELGKRWKALLRPKRLRGAAGGVQAECRLCGARRGGGSVEARREGE